VRRVLAAGLVGFGGSGGYEKRALAFGVSSAYDRRDFDQGEKLVIARGRVVGRPPERALVRRRG